MLNERLYWHILSNTYLFEAEWRTNKLTMFDSDNGFSPGRRQAIIWTNARKLLIRPLETNFNEIVIEI